MFWVYVIGFAVLATAGYLVWKRHGSEIIDVRDTVKDKADAVKNALSK